MGYSTFARMSGFQATFMNAPRMSARRTSSGSSRDSSRRSAAPGMIARKIQEINSKNPIISLAFDRWRIEDLKRELDAIGCRVPLEGFRQGYKDMSRAVDAVERLVDQGRLGHGDHPVLKMCVTNAVVTMDPAKNQKFDKSKSGGRIDALVALSMALAVVNKAKPEIDIDALIG